MNYLIMIGQMIMNKKEITSYLDELFNNPKCELEYTKDDTKEIVSKSELITKFEKISKQVKI